MGGEGRARMDWKCASSSIYKHVPFTHLGTIVYIYPHMPFLLAFFCAHTAPCGFQQDNSCLNRRKPAATISPPSAMYSSSYSRAKFALEAREPLHKPKGKSCGYYMRIIFFFSSLIQSLIIVSLVLFLIYGQPEKSAEEKRVKVSDFFSCDSISLFCQPLKTPLHALKHLKNIRL